MTTAGGIGGRTSMSPGWSLDDSESDQDVGGRFVIAALLPRRRRSGDRGVIGPQRGDRVRLNSAVPTRALAPCFKPSRDLVTNSSASFTAEECGRSRLFNAASRRAWILFGLSSPRRRVLELRIGVATAACEGAYSHRKPYQGQQLRAGELRAQQLCSGEPGFRLSADRTCRPIRASHHLLRPYRSQFQQSARVRSGSRASL